MINTILLIRPEVEVGKKEFPFGILYIATVLKNKYRVRILDLNIYPDKESEVEDFLESNPGAMLAVSALSGSYSWVKQITLRIKNKLPETKIVIGGHIAEMYELLLKNTGADFISLGEGEEMLPELINRLNTGGDLREVPGIAFLKDGEIVRTSIKLLKEFVLPDLTLIDPKDYFIHPARDMFFAKSQKYRAREREDDKLAAVIFSRGCLGACNYCYRHLPGHRQPAVEWCWKYLMDLYENYGVRYFRIDDELFTSNKEWFNQFYEKIKEAKIDILFRITGLRVDSIDNDLLAKLSEIGCIAINYGLESGSPEILKNMNKRTTVDQNKAAVNKTLAHGINAMAYIMLGYEGETNETLYETMDMLLDTDIDADYVSVFFTIPLPGTRLFKNCLARGLIRDEELFMEDIFDKIGSQEERYLVQLGEVTKEEMVGFRYKLIFLLRLKRIISKKGWLFKLIKKVIKAIPNKCRINKIFSFGQKVLNRFIKKFPALAGNK